MIELNRVFLILALVSVLLPVTSFFIVGDLPPVAGNVSAWLSIVGDYLSSQMVGMVIAFILFSISRMIEKNS